MFRLMFAPKATPGKGELPVLDKVFEDFNIFKIDVENKTVEAYITPNYSHGYRSYEKMYECLKEGWDVHKLNYTYNEKSSHLTISIPDGYDAVVVLK